MNKKITSVFLGIMMGAGVAFSETDYIATPIIADMQNGADNDNQIKTLRVRDKAVVPAIMVVPETSAARVMTRDDYGKHIQCTYAGAVAITLPPNGAPAGTQFWISQGTVQNDTTAITASAATTDTLVGPNDVDLKSVTWASGHRIGASARFWSDGGFWVVQNLGGTTMTYTD